MAFTPKNFNAPAAPAAAAAPAERSKLENVGRAYTRKTKSGDDYIRVQIKDVGDFNLFINKNKKEEKHPDYNVTKVTKQG